MQRRSEPFTWCFKFCCPLRQNRAPSAEYQRGISPKGTQRAHTVIHHAEEQPGALPSASPHLLSSHKTQCSLPTPSHCTEWWCGVWLQLHTTLWYPTSGQHPLKSRPCTITASRLRWQHRQEKGRRGMVWEQPFQRSKEAPGSQLCLLLSTQIHAFVWWTWSFTTEGTSLTLSAIRYTNITKTRIDLGQFMNARLNLGQKFTEGFCLKA